MAPTSPPAPVAGFLDDLRQAPYGTWRIVYHRRFPARPAQWADPAAPWPAAIGRLLSAVGIERLYAHQTAALNRVRAGQSVVVATPTASGKSLIYHLPLLEAILARPDTRALYLTPLKALAQDQVKRFRELAAHLAPTPISAAIYDGDTSAWHRRKIRDAPPHLVLTNPEMIHLSFLPYHDRWADLFRNLAFLIVDEVHTYRGVMGSHMAQVFRRLERICRHYGARPVTVFCSATVGNPEELAEKLTGAPAEAVTRTRTAAGERHIVLLDPFDGPMQTTLGLLDKALKRGLRTIVYTQSRKLAELISIGMARRFPETAHRISPYRAGLLPEARRRIETRLASGDLLAVISTSALELGIDIGDLDLCILVGYPGSMVSTWQRSGRVGRSGQPAALVLVAGDDALDQYFLRNPDAFIRKFPEAAVVNPENPFILERHLECAAAELPLAMDEPYVRGAAVQTAIARLEADAVLLRSGDGDRLFARRRYPQRDLDLRGGGKRYCILDAEETLLGEIDGLRVYREAHPGAIYLHEGRTFRVEALEIEAGRVRVVPAAADHFTRPRIQRDTDILETLDARTAAGMRVGYGRLRITEQVTGFERIHLRTGRKLGIEPLDLPPMRFETEGIWMEIPDRMQQRVIQTERHFMGGIHALEHAAIGILPLLVLSDRNDFGGLSTPFHPDTGGAAVFIYDGSQGGAGLSRLAFDRFEDLIRNTHACVARCPCRTGCPGCVHSPKCGSGNRPLDKDAAKMLLESMLASLSSEDAPVEASPVAETSAGAPEIAAAPTAPAGLQPSVSGRRRSRQKRRAKKRGGNGDTASVTVTSVPIPKAAGIGVDPSIDGPPAFGVLDIETQRSAQEVGGWHRADRMRVSCAVLYESASDRFVVFEEAAVPALIERLQQLDLVIGFNIKRFDYRVLSRYSDLDFSTIPTLDLLESIHRTLGFRLSLDHLASRTLGAKKTADGLQALKWWKEGRIREIIEYCRHDVAITRDLYRFGQTHGYVNFSNKAGDLVRVPVTW